MVIITHPNKWPTLMGGPTYWVDMYLLSRPLWPGQQRPYTVHVRGRKKGSGGAIESRSLTLGMQR